MCFHIDLSTAGFLFLSHIICFPLANKQNAGCMLCFSDLEAKPYKDIFKKKNKSSMLCTLDWAD